MKLMRLVLVVVFLMLWVLPVYGAVYWYPGTVHAHSLFSDGDRTPKMLKNAAVSAGGKFLIVTDHYEQIPQEKFGDVLNRYSGYQNYINSFADIPRKLVVIPGAEITISRGDAASHILAIGNPLNFLGFEFASSQQEVLDQLNGLGVMSVAAHPSFVDDSRNYQFDFTKAEGISGIEFFNDEENYKKTLFWYLKQIAVNNVTFVTSGCDSHTSVDPTFWDYLRWQRKTYVWTNSRTLTQGSLLQALSYGQTYAADNRAYFKKLNYLPQSVFQTVSQPVFNFTVAFAKNTTEPKTVQIFRDGRLAWNSRRVFPWGLRSFNYSWQDFYAPVGPHRYVIEVEKCLITSPINLIVTAPPIDFIDPVFSCFQRIAVQTFSWQKPWDPNIPDFMWSEQVVNPVPRANIFFQAPAYLEVYIIYRNRSSDWLRWQPEIYGPTGPVYLPFRWMGMSGTGPWQTCWVTYYVYLDEIGQYSIEFWDQTGTKLIGSQTITCY